MANLKLPPQREQETSSIKPPTDEKMETSSMSDDDNFELPSNDEWDDSCFEPKTMGGAMFFWVNLYENMRQLPPEVRDKILDFTLMANIEEQCDTVVTIRRCNCPLHESHEDNLRTSSIRSGRGLPVPQTNGQSASCVRDLDYKPSWQLAVNRTSRRTVAAWYHSRYIFFIDPTSDRVDNLEEMARWLESLTSENRAVLQEVRFKEFVVPPRLDYVEKEEIVAQIQAVEAFLDERRVSLGKNVLKILLSGNGTADNSVWYSEEQAQNWSGREWLDQLCKYYTIR